MTSIRIITRTHAARTVTDSAAARTRRAVAARWAARTRRETRPPAHTYQLGDLVVLGPRWDSLDQYGIIFEVIGDKVRVRGITGLSEQVVATAQVRPAPFYGIPFDRCPARQMPEAEYGENARCFLMHGHEASYHLGLYLGRVYRW